VVTLTVTPRLRRQYAVRFAAHSHALADYCAAHGVRYVRVPTVVPPAELVVGAPRWEGLVGRQSDTSAPNHECADAFLQWAAGAAENSEAGSDRARSCEAT
jgi:hypothetical protein